MSLRRTTKSKNLQVSFDVTKWFDIVEQPEKFLKQVKTRKKNGFIGPFFNLFSLPSK